MEAANELENTRDQGVLIGLPRNRKRLRVPQYTSVLSEPLSGTREPNAVEGASCEVTGPGLGQNIAPEINNEPEPDLEDPRVNALEGKPPVSIHFIELN